MVRDWTGEERETLRREVPKTALNTIFRNRTVADLARQMLDISRVGLKSRNRLNWEGADETVFLRPLEETLEIGKTPAEQLLDLYHGPWVGDIDRIFVDRAM
jgi:glutamate--cysteine ligase